VLQNDQELIRNVLLQFHRNDILSKVANFLSNKLIDLETDVFETHLLVIDTYQKRLLISQYRQRTKSKLVTYINVWIEIDMLEQLQNHRLITLEEQRKVKDKLRELQTKLPTKADLEKTNYKKYIEIINNEEYIKVKELEKSFKIRVKE